MALKILYYGFLGGLLLVLQVGFASALPGAAAGANLVLVAGVFILGARGLWDSLAWTIPLALLLDLLTFGPFGLTALGYAAALGLAYYLQQGFFTNRSLYSFLAIALSADLVFRALTSAGRLADAYWRAVEPDLFGAGAYWLTQLLAVAIDLLLVVAAFYALNFLSRQFQPVFLTRNR